MTDNEPTVAAETEQVDVKPDKPKLVIDMDNMSMRDMIDFEDIVGKSYEKAMVGDIVRDPKTNMPVKDPDDPKGGPLRESDMSMKVIYALIFVALRKDNPTITRDEVLDIRLSAFDLEFAGAEDGADPKSESAAKSE